MRKRIKVTGFSDWDTMFYNNVLSIPVLAIASLLVEDWSTANLQRNLYAFCVYLPSILTASMQPGGDTEFLAVRDHGLRCGCGVYLVHDGVVHPCDEQHDIQVRVIVSRGAFAMADVPCV